MISMHIPKGEKIPNLSKEMSSARRIKDRVTRVNTLTGLNKIKSYI